jgi:RNA polymerase sigma-70 factor (ECF subfamily)
LEIKETVILRYFSDLTVPEVAKVLGKPEGTIKSRLSRALSRLNEILSKDETLVNTEVTKCTKKD